jgi:hypothetical protein
MALARSSGFEDLKIPEPLWGGWEEGVEKIRIRAWRRRHFRAGKGDVHKDTVHAKLHHQRRIRRRRDSSCGEHNDRQPSKLRDLPQQLDGGSELLRHRVKLDLGKGTGAGDLGVDLASVTDGFDDIAGTCFACRCEEGVRGGQWTAFGEKTAAGVDKRGNEGKVVKENDEPFVLIIAAPSLILLSASPRSLQPQTKGTSKA